MSRQRVDSDELRPGDALRVRVKGGTTWIPAVVEDHYGNGPLVVLDGGIEFGLAPDRWDFEREAPIGGLDPIDYMNEDQVGTIQVAEYVLSRASRPLHAQMLRRQFPSAFKDEK